MKGLAQVFMEMSKNDNIMKSMVKRKTKELQIYREPGKIRGQIYKRGINPVIVCNLCPSKLFYIRGASNDLLLTSTLSPTPPFQITDSFSKRGYVSNSSCSRIG